MLSVIKLRKIELKETETPVKVQVILKAVLEPFEVHAWFW